MTDGRRYFSYTGVPFGLGAAVVIWGRAAAWFSCLAQAAVGDSSTRVCTYVDDPIVISAGGAAERTRAFARVLVVWAAVNAPKHRKIRGRVLWGQFLLRLGGRRSVLDEGAACGSSHG